MKPADEPTRKQFALKFLQAMKRVQSADDLYYDMDRFAIIKRGGNLEETSLLNLYQEYVRLPSSRRSQFITQAVESAALAKAELPLDFNKVRDRLRPRLWLRSVVASTLLQAQLEEGQAALGLDLPDIPIGGHLISTVVYDLTSGIRSLPRAQFEKWGVSYEEGLRIARENLSRTPFRFASLADGIYCATTADHYDAARLLLPDLLDRWKVDGDPIALVPNRNVLLMTGSNNAFALQMLAKLTIEALKEPRPLSSIPLRWNGTAWEDWLVPRNHSAYQEYHELELRFLASEYQHVESLKEHLRRQSREVVIHPVQAGNTQGGGNMFSYTAWRKDVPCLMPKVDRLILCVGEGPATKILATGSWTRIQEICGHLFEKAEYYPPRYFVNGFPTEEELRTIGMEPL